MRASRERCRRIGPRSAAVRCRRTKLCRPVEHRHRAVGLGGAVQGHVVGGRDRVAADHWRGWCHRIDGDGKDSGGRAGGARHGIGCGKAVGAIRQGAGGETPRSTRVGSRGADLCRAVKYFHCAIRRRRTGQRQCAVVGDPVTHHAAIGRERGNGRRRRR